MYYPEPVEQRTVNFTAEQINDYLGTSIEKDRMVDILTKLEFGITESGDTIEVLVPTWRDDVTGMPDICGRSGAYRKL